jgi:hypothetical protein
MWRPRSTRSGPAAHRAWAPAPGKARSRCTRPRARSWRPTTTSTTNSCRWWRSTAWSAGPSCWLLLAYLAAAAWRSWKAADAEAAPTSPGARVPVQPAGAAGGQQHRLSLAHGRHRRAVRACAWAGSRRPMRASASAPLAGAAAALEPAHRQCLRGSHGGLPGAGHLHHEPGRRSGAQAGAGAKLALSVSASGGPERPRLEATRREILQLVREGIAINPHYRKITPMVADELARWGDWRDATWIWESVLARGPTWWPSSPTPRAATPWARWTRRWPTWNAPSDPAARAGGALAGGDPAGARRPGSQGAMRWPRRRWRRPRTTTTW